MLAETQLKLDATKKDLKKAVKKLKSKKSKEEKGQCDPEETIMIINYCHHPFTNFVFDSLQNKRHRQTERNKSLSRYCCY